MIASRYDIFLVHVICGETMKQCQPCTRAPKISFAAVGIGASDVINEFSPTVVVTHKRMRRFQFYWGPCPVQPLDKLAPRKFSPQVFWFIHHTRTVREGDNLNRMPSIVRVGEIAVDPGNQLFAIGGKYFTPNCRQISVKTQDKFARRLDPLPYNDSKQPQEHRLVFE